MQDLTLHFKHQSKDLPAYTKFTSLLYEDYPYFSYIYRINFRTKIRLKPNSTKIAHFPIKIFYNLHFTTTQKKNKFSLQFRIHISLLICVQHITLSEVFTDDEPDTCATFTKPVQIALPL